MKKLIFPETGIFKIMQLTDIHYCSGNEADHETTALMERLLEEEKPDFVMITGDTVYGENNVHLLRPALQPILSAGVPFTFLFGNHDTEDGEGYEAICRELRTLPGYVGRHDETAAAGWCNHMLPLQNRAGELFWVIAGLNSGNYCALPHIEGYAYVKREQINWYEKRLKAYEQKAKDFSVLAFMHIPLPEHNEVWDTQTCYGEKRESICAPPLNSGLFAAMQEIGHTKGLFVGHDHVNDFRGSLHGIELGYGRATGYNTYGHEGFERGCRIFLLKEDKSGVFETYLRLADGSLIQSQTPHEPGQQEEQG